LSGSVAALALVRAEELSRGSSAVPLDGSGGTNGANVEASADPSQGAALSEDSAVLAPAVTDSAVGCSACAGSSGPSGPPAADSSEERALPVIGSVVTGEASHTSASRPVAPEVVEKEEVSRMRLPLFSVEPVV
jgi:hypothetical protein